MSLSDRVETESFCDVWKCLKLTAEALRSLSEICRES